MCVGKRYASGGAAPTRGVSFSNDCAPDTRSASRRPKPARASIVLRAHSTGGPRSSFSEALLDRKAAPSICTYHCCDIHAQAQRRGQFWRMSAPAGQALALARKQPRRLRIGPEEYGRAEKGPLDFTTRTSCQSLPICARPQRATIPRRRRATGRSDRATSRRRRAIASRGSRTRGQPLANKIEPGQP